MAGRASSTPSALRHDQSNKAYNQSFRQLLHVGFKVAAKMGDRYIKALEANEDVVAAQCDGQSCMNGIFARYLSEGRSILSDANHQLFRRRVSGN